VSREKLIGAWYLLLSGHGLGLALPCAGIGLGALTPHRQTLQAGREAAHQSYRCTTERTFSIELLRTTP